MYPDRPLLERMTKLATMACFAADQYTYCNNFASMVATAFGASLPPVSANDQYKHLQGSPEWFSVGFDYTRAHVDAEAGRLVLAAVQASGHGHIAVVIPGKMQFSGMFKRDLPMIAQAGKSSFCGKMLSFGFSKDHAPEIFIWKGIPS